jgi:hypothetical protein
LIKFDSSKNIEDLFYTEVEEGLFRLTWSSRINNLIREIEGKLEFLFNDSIVNFNYSIISTLCKTYRSSYVIKQPNLRTTPIDYLNVRSPEKFLINHSIFNIHTMKSILLFLLILIFHVSSFAQSDPVAIAQNIELFPDVRGDYTVTASAVDNGSSDTDGPISTTIETALTTSRPAITYNQTHINKGSVYFDGNDKRISTTVQNLPLGNSARTIEFWMRPQATGAFQYILDYGVGATNQRFAIYIAGTRMGVAYGGNAAEISGINSFNEWAHYAITYSTRTFKFYKNGVLIGQSTIASDLQTANSQFFIGNLFNTTNFDFKGDITELKIHRVAKTDAELLTDYNKYSTGNESETVFYNKLNEGTGNAINDGKFLSAGNLAVGGGGSQPVWSSSYPTAAFQNSIGTYHVILMVTDNTGNTTTDDAVITLNNSVPPVVQSQNIVATLDSNGQATITPQQVNNGTLDAYGNAVTNFSLNQTTFNCSDLASIDLNSQYVADLRGANDYISAGSSSTLQVTTAFSYAGWINNTSRNLESMLVNREGEYEVALRNNGNIAYALANSSPGWDWVETNVNVPLNKWAHVAFTYESGSPKIYLNGKLEYTGTGTGAIGDVTTFQNDVRFGWRQNQGGNAKFTGFMDEISLWNRVLSAQEIKNLVTTTLSGRESGLLVHYAIENGTTATLVDSSSNNLSGTIVSPVATPRPLNTDYRDAYGTEVTLTATDSFGTTATATAFVEVQDVTVPVITCPSNISENSLDASGKVVTYTLPTIQDACVTGATAIDPSSAFPQPNGTTLLGTFNNHSYFLSDTPILPSDAFAATASTPYKLATINSAAENDFLTAFVDDGTGFLLGFNDVASEGAFLWQDGSTASYTNWNANEPNNSAGSEDFTVLLPNGKWNDIGDGSRKYIVELPYIYEQTAGIATGANFPIGTTTNTFIFNDGNGNTATCSFDVELILEAVPTLDVVSIVSNNVDDSAFAKAGNTITLNFTASEDLANTPVVTIAGQNATVSQGANARSWIATFQMPTVQATSLVDLPNGIAGFTINFIDLASIAGVEVTSTTDASQVSLNRTPPTAIAQDIELCPDGSGAYIANATSIDNGSSDPDEGIVPTIETSLASGVASQNFNQTHINKGSIYFDGNDRSVSTPIQNLPSGNSARTIEFWMKPSVTSQTGQYVFDYGVGGTFRRYAVLVNTDGRLGVLLGGGIAFTNSPVFTFDTWAHYSITYENRVFIFYIDGVEVGRNTIPRDLDTGNSNLIIGNLLNNTTFDFKGNLSELRIYDRAKTPTQITTNYKKYLAGNEEGLVYYNKLNEGTGAAIDDSRFNIAGDIPIGGTGQPVWSTDYPSITFDNEIGTYHTILTATDSNGNVATDDAVVTLKDGTPVVQAQDILVSLDANGSAIITPQQVDNGSTVCEGAVGLNLDRTTFNCSDIPVQGVSVQQLTGGSTGGISQSAVWQSFTAVNDAALNKVSFEFSAPSNSTSSNVSLNLYENEGTAGTLVATSSDVITLGSSSGSSQFYDFGFSNVDITVGTIYTVELVSTNRASVTWIPVNRSNPYAGGRSSLDPTMDSIFKIETTDPPVVPVTLTVTDSFGNSNQATVNVTIEDTIDPVITLTGDTTIELPLNGIYNEPGATLTDNCTSGNSTLVIDSSAIDTSQAGSYTVTYNYIDASGNPATQVSRTVEVIALPTVVTQNITAILDATGNATITPQQVNNGSTDADGNLITNLSLDQTTFSCSDLSSGIQSSFSVNLDGTNDFVSTGIDADVLAMPQTTWEGWINPNALTAGFQMIFSVDDGGWDRFLSLNGNNLVLSNGNSAATVTTMQPSVWQHVAVTYDQVNNEAFVYINGLQYGAYATTYANSDNTNDTFTLGKNSGGVNYFNGRIDEVRVWNTVRTPAQIKANYNSTVAVNETGLVAYYNFEEGTGTTASDISTASVNNATLNNFAAATAWNEGVRSYTEVDLTVTDNLGNINIGSALVEVIDNIAPVITLTGDATITLPINGVYNDQGATATDNCSLDGTGLVIDNSDVDTSLAGSYTVTYNATDEAGNSTTASRTVNVEDLTPPTLSDITIASNNTISNDIAGIGNTVNLSFTPSEPITNVTATFGGNNMTVVIPATAGDAYTATYIVQDGDDAGATGFSIRAEDLAANAVTVTTASTGTSTIDVDAIAPTFDYLRLSSRGGGESPGFAIPRSFTILSFTASEVVTPTTTIAGQPSSFTNFDSDDGVYGIGITIPQISTLDQTAMPDGNVTFSITLTDAKGNTTTRTSTTDGSSIILDRTPPSVVMIQPSAFILNSSNRAPVSLSEVYDSSSDANGIASVELEEDNFGCFDVGTESVRMVTVEDNAGNITRGVVDITVIDNVPPVITTDWPATQTVSVGNFPPSPNTRYTDNCTVVTRGSNLDDLDVSVPNTFTYTASATDAGGNTTTITRIVEVIQQPYIYDNGAWTPNDPSLSSNPSRFNSDVIVRESVTVSDDFNAHDLTIENGSMLSLASGVIVTIDNDCDAVAINAPSATLVAKDQTSSNSWTLNNTILGTLELDNATLELTGTIRVMNRLYNNDSASTSTLDVTSANLILNSNATSTAVVDGAGIMINGEVTVENYFNDRRAFRFLSSPVTTTTTINDNYQEGGNTPAGYGTDITGAGGAANGFDVSGSNNPSMFGWDNLNQTFTVQGSTDQAQDVLVAGQYSRLFIRGDRNVDLTSNTSSSATTLRTTGQLLNGNYTLPSIAANDNEFIIVGNPYQNKISIANEMNQLFNLSSTNINAVKPNFYFVWDPMANTRGAYRTYSRQIDMMTGANPANSDYDEAGILQPGQAAFMYASGTTLGSFVLSRPSNIPARRGEEMANTAEGILDISLYETSQFAQGLGSLDGLFVRFETGANNDVDGNDAVKFANLDENLGRQHDDGTSLIVEIRDVPQPQEVLVLKTDQYRHQNYTLRFAPLGFVSVQGKLRDNFTNTLTDLDNAQETIYNFTVDSTDASSIDENRFEVIFENTTLSTGDVAQVDAIKLYPNPITNGTFFINMAGLSGEKEVAITNLLGQSIITYSTNATGVEEFNTTTLAPAVYLVQITTKGRTKTIKVIVE